MNPMAITDKFLLFKQSFVGSHIADVSFNGAFSNLPISVQQYEFLFGEQILFLLVNLTRKEGSFAHLDCNEYLLEIR
jgi:hypothetical protein